MTDLVNILNNGIIFNKLYAILNMSVQKLGSNRHARGTVFTYVILDKWA